MMSPKMFRILLAVLLSVAFILAGAPVAGAADPISNAANALRSTDLYVDSDSVHIDDSAVRSALPSGVKIAVLSDYSGDPTAAANDIGRALDPDESRKLTIGVLLPAAHKFAAASSKYCRGYANQQAAQATSDATADLKQGNYSTVLEDFGRRMQTGPLIGTSCSAASGGTTASSSDTGGSSGWGVIGGLAAILALGAGGLFVFSRRRRSRQLDLARAKVMPYYDRLADDVNTLNPGDNERAKQAIADASARFTSAGSMLASANSVEKYAIARRTVLEGLYSTRAARVALGLDPGADLPALDGSDVGHLQQPQQVTVQGQNFQGYPVYSPSAPYYFGGGWGVPGGWYGSPFWETMLLGSMLGGGFGGFGGFGGGGFERGYDSGYGAGYDAAEDRSQPGGDWNNGGGGGGDWGGGGGDWGGGGGDWGGGGGDWGGGGNDSGGSW